MALRNPGDTEKRYYIVDTWNDKRYGGFYSKKTEATKRASAANGKSKRHVDGKRKRYVVRTQTLRVIAFD